MQRVIFHWMTSARFHFRFDDCPGPGGSHHQKFVIVDGALAFLGGMDVCEARWDDRCHRAVNPVRLSRGKPQKPYHDVQAYLRGGSAVPALQALFAERWARAGGGPLPLPPRDRAPARGAPIRHALPLGAVPVALSRTDPLRGGETVREVERLFEDAIDAAESLIYMETQYFSSRRIREALARRMRDAGRPGLEIVIVVNERAEALKEELAVGLRQAQNLEQLRRVAAETGQTLGLYFTRCDGANDAFSATYIHSKLIAVDDRFLTVGSANLTNRSLAVDSELHAAWEVPPGGRDPALTRRIRHVRVSLLAEHCGLSGIPAGRALARMRGLVGRLDEIASRPGARLQRHGPPTPAQAAAMEIVDPQSLPFDPETSDDEAAAIGSEPTDEHHRGRSGVGSAIGALWRRLRRREDAARRRAARPLR
jgi:phosphatidylserine/phosphatidylglycerophosphate/cardiolipin synthase-like enzyme